jgi:hypothetical protein
MHSIVDSLNDISYGILEGDFTKDETVNAIDGLAVLTKVKIEKLFDVFMQVFELDQYRKETTNSLDGCSNNFHSPEAWF